MKKQIKAFIGVIGSGKDYQCKKLVDEGYTQIAFADTLRELTWSIFKWKPNNQEEYDEFKSQIFSAAGYPSFTGREFLQRLGTNARELIDENIWVKSIEKRFNINNKFCISDMRFPNELKFIINLNPIEYDVEIIFTNYKSDRYKDNDKHISEKMAQEFLSKGYNHLETIFRNQPKIGDIIKIKNTTTLSNKFIDKVLIIEEIITEGYFDIDYKTNNGLILSRIEFDIIEPIGIKPLTNFI